MNGRVARARGAASEHACPSAAFKTAGQERYIAISVETAAQWSALCRLAPLSDFGSPDLDRLSARCEQRDTIEARLSEWCATRDAFELAGELQRAGVPAYAVLRPMDLYENEQLTQRGFFVTLDHAEMGPTAYDGFVTRFSRTPGRLRSAAPCLGQHTTEVLRDVLSLSDDEIARYAESGALA